MRGDENNDWVWLLGLARYRTTKVLEASRGYRPPTDAARSPRSGMSASSFLFCRQLWRCTPANSRRATGAMVMIGIVLFSLRFVSLVPEQCGVRRRDLFELASLLLLAGEVTGFEDEMFS